ncbi:hypothetical protein [Celeribacter sp.]|uniref:hypothetical protein n=1 Tax=Celeribacter sp. TaxID=1890673 RepID=UPI003A8E9C84
MKQFKVDELMEWTPPMPDRYREGYLLGAYPEERLRKVMWKYLMRESNMRRAWVRINAHPSKWIEIAREFCRIARKTVVIGFNPPAVSKFEEDFDAARAAWLDFQRFDEMGFRVDFFEVGNTRRGVHPTACKLVAIN